MKWSLILCLIFGFGILIYLKNYNSSEYYENWWQRFNVHSSPKHRLVFQGLSFDDVKGRKPFYIKLPSIHAIMFVQNWGEGQRIVVLYEDGKSVIFKDPYGKFLEEPGGPDLLSVVSSDKGIKLEYSSELVSVIYWFDLVTLQISTMNSHGDRIN
ncbi:MAG: hypothetical protein ABI162_05530 [Luteolibacter sp.]